MLILEPNLCQINIRPGNALLPDHTKPLPQPMMMYFQLEP